MFRDIVGPSGVITDTDDLAGHNMDWSKKYSGNSGLLLKPKTTEEVSLCLKHCHERMIAVVP